MHEEPPKSADKDKEEERRYLEKERLKEKFEIVPIALELAEVKEGFPFPGMDRKTYASIKADEEEFPGYTTPIDPLLERFRSEGMKVVVGKNIESGNIFILPLQSGDVEHDSIFPRQLDINDNMDERLKKLILLTRKLKNG